MADPASENRNPQAASFLSWRQDGLGDLDGALELAKEPCLLNSNSIITSTGCGVRRKGKQGLLSSRNDWSQYNA